MMVAGLFVIFKGTILEIKENAVALIIPSLIIPSVLEKK